MALSIQRNPYTGLPDVVGTGGGGGGATFSGGMSTLGNTSGNTGFGTNRLVLAGGNNITLSGSTNGGSMTITISGGAGGGGGIAAAAGTQTATSGTVNFVDSNGITFGMSGSNQITASHNGITSQSNPAFSASGGSSTFQTLSFANSNGATFRNTNGSIVLSYTVPNTAFFLTALTLSAGTQSDAASAYTFANSNGVSFGLNNQTITASHNGLTSQSNQALSGSNGSFTFQTATFGNLNGLSFYSSNGSLVGSHNGITSQSNPAFSASGGSSTFQTINFANSNGFTFSNSAGSVIGSYTVPTVPAQTNQTIGAYAVSNTTGAASSTTLDARSFSFQGAGIASVGMTNGSVVISVPSGGGAGDGGNVLAAGSQTANTTGTVAFVNSNRITFGMSNSSQITASYSHIDPTVSAWEPRPFVGLQAMIASSLLIQRQNLRNNISATQLDFVVGVTGSSSAGATLTYTAAVYTQTASTLSLASSGTVTYGWNSTAASSYSGISLTRYHSVPVTFNMTPGDYYFGFIFNSTSSATVGTYSIVGNASVLTLQALPFGGGNKTNFPFYGVYSAATTAPPSSIHLSQVVQTTNVAVRPPWFALMGTF